MTDDGFIQNDLRIRCSDAIELVTDYLDDALNDADLDDFRTHLGLCDCLLYTSPSPRDS